MSSDITRKKGKSGRAMVVAQYVPEGSKRYRSGEASILSARAKEVCLCPNME